MNGQYIIERLNTRSDIGQSGLGWALIVLPANKNIAIAAKLLKIKEIELYIFA